MQPKLSSITGNDFGQFWLLVEKFYHPKYYSSEYPDLLANFLHRLQVKDVLDAACGIGFPALSIFGKGFNLTCSDGNESMLNVFRQTANERGANIPIIHSKWFELASKFENSFDTILCLDSSITHVDSWADPKNLDTETAKQDILRSLQSFYKLLKPEGHAIVGLGKYAFDKGKEFAIDFGTLEIEGIAVRHQWKMKFDHGLKKRTWTLVTEFEGKTDIKKFQSYLLYPEELEQLLTEAGFKEVTIQEIEPGEYDNNFVARK
jgi:SAM-dependent methyltransferase